METCFLFCFILFYSKILIITTNNVSKHIISKTEKSTFHFVNDKFDGFFVDWIDCVSMTGADLIRVHFVPFHCTKYNSIQHI